MKSSNHNLKFNFLSGGGEMGRLIRAKDWSQTPLGDPEGWPQSLRTMISVMLDNPFGMYIAWGKEYTQIYNDGYRPILGETKHPRALGISTKETFAEIWNIIESMFEGVMKGVPVGFPDFMLPLNRNGYIENCYFDFAYSPIRMENGEVGGVLVTVIETTNKKKAEEALKESNKLLQFAIDATDLATWEIDPVTKMFSGDNRLKNWHGLSESEDFEPETGLNAVYEQDREMLVKAINEALDFSSGGLFNIDYTIINPVNQQLRIVRAKGKVLFNEEKAPLKFTGTLQNVTDEVMANRKREENERNLRLMILQAPIAIAILRGDNYIVEIANTKALQLWGRKEEEVLNKPVLEAMPELEGQGIKELLDGVRLTGKRFATDELPVQLMRNEILETIYINFSYEALYDADQKINGIMAIGFDVSQQVIARKKVEEAEQKSRLAINSAELGVYEIEYATNQMVTDKRFKEIWEVETDVTRNEYASSIHPDDMKARLEAHKNSLITGQLDYQARIIRKDKSVKWLRIMGTVIYDDAKTPVKLIGVIQDISESAEARKKIEEVVENRTKELTEVNDSLEKMNKELQSFAYISSHDLQEPLRKIQTFASQILEKEQDRLSESGKDKFHRMQKAANRMQTLIDDLLAYSRTSTSDRKFENTNLHNLLVEIQDDLKEELQNLHAVVENHLACEINIIPFQFRQLLFNLISNALKFARKNNPPHVIIKSEIFTGNKEIHPKLENEKTYCHILVSDNGIGFEQRFSEQIFDVFQRLHGREQYKGTGIGLAIVKKIVENHQGVITATGAPNIGATFNIYIPVL